MATADTGSMKSSPPASSSGSPTRAPTTGQKLEKENLNSSNPTTPNCDEEEAEDDDLKNLNEDEQLRQKLARIQKRLEESHRHFLREIDRISKEEKALLEYCEELKEVLNSM